MADSENMEVEAAAADVAVVPETLLKKRKRDEQWASARKQQLEASRTKSAKNRQLIFKRAEQYIKEYRSQVMRITAHD
jgi:large subunit ribosomal protein L7e